MSVRANRNHLEAPSALAMVVKSEAQRAVHSAWGRCAWVKRKYANQ